MNMKEVLCMFVTTVLKGVVHFKKKTFADDLLTLVEKKLRFLMKTFQDFLHIMDFNGNQMVQGPNESSSGASKGFKQHQTMNKG